MSDLKRDKEVVIFVNTEEHAVPDGDISYEAVTALAFPDLASDQDQSFSVSYRRGPSANEQGSLAKDGTVKVKNKMIFDVTPTTRS